MTSRSKSSLECFRVRNMERDQTSVFELSLSWKKSELMDI